MRGQLIKWCAGIVLLGFAGGLVDDGDRTDAVRQAVVGVTARNVILFIGDGMGDSEITLARNYAVGAEGRLALDTLPLTGAYTTPAAAPAAARQTAVCRRA